MHGIYIAKRNNVVAMEILRQHGNSLRGEPMAYTADLVTNEVKDDLIDFFFCNRVHGSQDTVRRDIISVEGVYIRRYNNIYDAAVHIITGVPHAHGWYRVNSFNCGLNNAIAFFILQL